MAKRFTYGATFRSRLRKSRRLQIQQGNGGFSVYLGSNPGTGTLVRSVLTLIHHSTPFQKQVLKEVRKVQKRIEELEAQGYTFPAGGLIDDIKNGKVKFSKKFLDKVKGMNKNFLRQHAASYQGETDINKIIAKRNREVAEKRRQTLEAKRKKQITASGQNTFDDLIPTDMQVKIDNIMEEEMRYLQEIVTYRGVVDPDLFAHASMAANEVLRLVNTSTDEEKEVIIDFWEQNGGLSGVIESASTRFRGLFYEQYAVGFNLNFMELTPYGKESWFKDLFPDEEPSETSEFIPISNEDDIPFD